MDLRSDPFETAWGNSAFYDKWAMEHVFMIVPAQTTVGKYLNSFATVL